MFFFLYSASLFSRAGGGGGHGGGGGGFSGGHGGSSSGQGTNDSVNSFLFWLMIIALAIWAFYAMLVSYFLAIRSEKADAIAQQSMIGDRLWNIRYMTDFSHKMFHEMQYAWSARSMHSVKNKVTKYLYNKYTDQLNAMKQSGERNIIRDIEITEIKLISCEDHKDNSKDAFIAYLSGTILDYTIKETTGYIITNPDQTRESFADTYHFVRDGNSWKLNDITNDLSLRVLIDSKNSIEK